MKRGLTIIELLIVISIFGIITLVIVKTFSLFNTNQALDKDTQAIVAFLDDAKSKTLASKDANQYGIHLASSSVTLFKGTSFSSSDPENKVYALDRTVYIFTQALVGGGTNIIFSRLTGETSQSGTITIASTRASSTRTVTIYKTGAIESN
jgi:prepilin-type N-terminal cleavage/methylation domain-containing protein